MSDWNAPIDQIQADCMTARELIRGWFAEAKERVQWWDIAPCPEEWR